MYKIMHNIEKYLNSDEEILFKGTYNINTINQTSPVILSLRVFIEANPCGSNILIDNFYNTSDNLIPPNNFLLETITISSYQNDLLIKTGQIQYTSFYRNNSSIDSAVTTEELLVYQVNSVSGIYEGVNKVFLIATSDERLVLFIGKKKHEKGY